MVPVVAKKPIKRTCCFPAAFPTKFDVEMHDV